MISLLNLLPRRWKWDLRKKFIFGVTFLVVLIILSAVMLVEWNERSIIIDQVEKRGLTIARNLAAVSMNSLVTYNYIALEQFVSRVSNEPGLVYAIVFDKERHIAAYSSRDESISKSITEDLPVSYPKNSIGLRRFNLGAKEDKILEISMPVYIDMSDEQWGCIRIGLSLMDMERAINDIRMKLSILGFGAAFAGYIGALWLSKRIINPIREVAKGIIAVGKGDFSKKISINTGDELEELACSFNSMSNQLLLMKEMETQLRKTERLAALGKLAANVAHEVKNPLTVIRNFTYILLKRFDDRKFMEQFCKIIPDELNRINNIIEELLQLGRPVKFLYRKTDINAVVGQTAAFLKEKASETDVKIVTELACNIPQISTDSEHIYRSFLNLGLNAIQAMPEGGTLTISTGIKEINPEIEDFGDHPDFRKRLQDVDNRCIEIKFKDTGCGISADVANSLFDPFFTTKEKGSGLGLAITSKIIEEHGGIVYFQSKVGEGSIFTILLPLQKSLLEFDKPSLNI